MGALVQRAERFPGEPMAEAALTSTLHRPDSTTELVTACSMPMTRRCRGYNSLHSSAAKCLTLKECNNQAPV